MAQHFFSGTSQAIPALIYLCLAAFFSPPLLAEESEPPHIGLLEPLDSSRDAASQQVINFANWLDSFFADERVFDESQNSHLKLNLMQVYEEGVEPRFEASLQGKLILPNTQKRLKLLLESDPGDNANPDDTIVEAVENQQQSLGLRYIQFTSDWLRAHTDIGVRLRSSGLDTFVRFRLRGLFSLGNWNLRATETLFWRDSTGPGASTRLDFERRFNKSYLFRATSRADWFDETRQFDLGQDFFLIHTIHKYRAVIYRAGLSAVSEPTLQTTDYILSVRLRQQIHRDWLFFEINPRVLYPLEDNFEARRSITFKLEVVFGGI